jgi:hypothetical protein
LRNNEQLQKSTTMLIPKRFISSVAIPQRTESSVYLKQTGQKVCYLPLVGGAVRAPLHLLELGSGVQHLHHQEAEII